MGNSKGLSIVEVLITVFLLGGLAYFATTLFQSNKTFQNVNQSKTSSTFSVQNIIGRTVSLLRKWDATNGKIKELFNDFDIGDGELFSFYNGTSSIDTVVGSKVKSLCRLKNNVSAGVLNFCLFSKNSTPIKINGAMLSARVIHIKVQFKDMRDSSNASSDKLNQIPALYGGKVEYFFHNWTKANSKHIKNTIRGVFYFSE